ncbi:protein let-653-like [Astyanax mexicanus]|uniref:protein let-653-like n=1 Tax=Astyanax mexicanus TaxID=7994 RepID=UPI0020CAE37D|nr:protein let-653-like [Astyanax mexicanus]
MDTNLSQKDRFSISDNRRSRVVSVRISDVREEDGGVYYCAVAGGGDELGYYSLFSEIHLQVSARPRPSERPTTIQTGKSPSITYNSKSSPPGKTSPDANGSSSRTPSAISTAPPAPTVTPSGNFIIVIIITVSICLVLLLIGGLTLICKRRCSKTQGSYSSNLANMGGNDQVSHSASDYEEIRDIRPHLDTQTTPLYSTIQQPTNPLTTVYVLAQRPSTSPAQGIYNMVQLPQPSPEAQGYSTVSFLKNPDSDTDASVTF